MVNNIPNTLSAMLLILENPFVEKGYKALKKCYEQANRLVDVEAMEHLLEVKFGTNNSDSVEIS